MDLPWMDCEHNYAINKQFCQKLNYKIQQLLFIGSLREIYTLFNKKSHIYTKAFTIQKCLNQVTVGV